MEQDAKAPGANAPTFDHHRRQITLVHQQMDSRQIFQDCREVTIVHGNENYRLRLTAQNKLILTK